MTTTFPNPDVAGTVGTVTVTAQDAYGNVVSSSPNPYLGTVDLTSTDGQASGVPASYTFSRRRRRHAHVHERDSEDGGDADDHGDRLRHERDHRQRRWSTSFQARASTW